MIDPNLTLKYLYSIETDLIFEGYWQGEWFQAIFVSGEYEYGWHDMTFLRQFSKTDQGVFTEENEEYDDIYDALTDVDISVSHTVSIT